MSTAARDETPGPPRRPRDETPRLEPEDFRYASRVLREHVPNPSDWLAAYVACRVARAWSFYTPARSSWSYFRAGVVRRAIDDGLDRERQEAAARESGE